MLQDEAKTRFLLVIDQFEELYTSCKDAGLRDSFVDMLLSAADSEGPISIVLAVRPEFCVEELCDKCDSFRRIGPILENQSVVLEPLDGPVLEKIIEEPARAAGWQLENGLARLVLEDIRQANGTLPLLSYALLRAWQKRQGSTLTVNGYLEFGGIQGLVLMIAEAESVKPVFQEDMARRVFLCLIDPGKKGLADRRRQARLAELILRPEDWEPVRKTLLHLVNARLVVTNLSPEGGVTVDLAHDALFRQWPKMIDWVDDWRPDLQIHRQLREAADVWVLRSKPPLIALYEGPELVAACDWYENNPRAGELVDDMEREFLETSRLAEEDKVARKERERQILRALSIGLTIFFLIALGGFIFAFIQGQRAASSAASEAVAKQEAIDAEATAVVIAQIAQTRRAEAQAEAEQRATAQALEAEAREQASENEQRAEERAQEAMQAREEASRARDTAEIKAGEAQARKLTIQAFNSREVDPQRWLLLATEAFSLASRSDIAGTIEIEEELRRALQRSPQLTELAHDDPVNVLAFHPAGELLATGLAGQTRSQVRLWRLGSGEALTTTLLHGDNVVALAFSPDGAILASGAQNGEVKLWDVSRAGATGAILPLQSPDRQPDGLATLALSPDGAWLVAAGRSGSIRAWRLQDLLGGEENQKGSEPLTPVIEERHRGFINDLSFGPRTEGNEWLLATAGSDGTVRFWHLGSHEQSDEAIHLESLWNLNTPILDIALDPAGTTIAAGTTGGSVRLWDWSAGREIATPLESHGRRVNSVAFGPRGDFLASGSDNETVRLWDRYTGAPPITLSGHTGGITQVRFSSDGRFLATAGLDGATRVWDVAGGELLTTLEGHEAAINNIAFSPDNTVLASGSADSTARIWTVTPNEEQAVLAGHETAVVDMLSAGLTVVVKGLNP